MRNSKLDARNRTRCSFSRITKGFGFNAIANSAGFLNGLGNANETVASPGSENYFLGGYDWTISNKDSLFASYIHDKGGLLQPFSGGSWEAMLLWGRRPTVFR